MGRRCRHRYKRLIVLVTSVTIVIDVLTACNVTFTRVDPTDPFDALPAWSPDGRFLVHVCYWPDEKANDGWETVYADSPASKWLEICTTDLDSHRRFRITYDEQYNSDPSWSADGGYVAFVGENSLFVSTPGGAEVKPVSLGKQITHYPGQQYVWSLDGLQLCFAADAFGDLGSFETDLFLVNLSEMTLRQLTDLEGAELEPRWSPTDDRLAFIWSPKNVETNVAQIHILDVGSGNSEIIKTFEGTSLERRAISDLTWSPDGKLLAFIGSWSSFQSAVYLIDIDTRQLDRITAEVRELSDLAWSPDGSRLAFVGPGSRGVAEIFSIKSNGTDLKQLTDQRDFGYGGSLYMTQGQRLAWSPDGQFLAFARNGKGELEQRIWIIKSDGSGSPKVITSD